MSVKKCSMCKVEMSIDFFPKSGKRGYHHCCKLCKSIESKKYRLAHKDEVNKRSLDWHEKNHDKSKENSSNWRASNVEHKKNYWKKWYLSNRDFVLANKRKNNDPAKNCMYSALRRATKKSHSPQWAIKFYIEEAYKLAQLRTKLFGIRWVVDHIVPLKNNLVCGLHSHTNLQVVTESYNASKNNKWWPNMPNEI